MPSAPPLRVREVDGSPTLVYPTELVFPNGTLTKAGSRMTYTPAGGGGTVTSVSVVTANGISGSVATATTTPAITLTVQNTAADGATKGIAGFTAADFNASSGIISIDYTNGQAADATHKGFLPAADFVTFNAKVGGSGTTNTLSKWIGASTLGDSLASDDGTSFTVQSIGSVSLGDVGGAGNSTAIAISDTGRSITLTGDTTIPTGKNLIITNGLTTLGGNVKLGGILYPAADSTTAIRITQADATTPFVTFDSTNKRVGINKTPGAFDLDINGGIKAANVTDSGLTAGRVTFAGTGGLLSDSANLGWTSPTLLISGATTTGPDVEVSITGDTTARVALGINTSDVARVSFGPGNANRDLFIERAGAATVRWGAPDAAAPVAQIDGVQNVMAGTSNTAGANRTFKGSAGTGTGAGGSFIVQVAPAGSTGTSQNSFATALTIDSTKLATFAAGITSAGINTITPAAASAALVSTTSNTGSDATSAWTLNHTLNTSGSPDVFAIKVTDTARGASTKLFNIYGGASGTTTEFSIDRSGNVAATGQLLTTSKVIGGTGLQSANANGAIYVGFNAANTLDLPNNAVIGFSSDATFFGTRDLFITRRTTANLNLGATDAASPVAQSLSTQGATGTDANAAGPFAIVGSLQTGTGVPGRVTIKTGALNPTSGSSAGTAVERLIVGATKVLTNNTTTTVTNVTVASNTVAAGIVDYEVEVFDGTNLQHETGSFIYQVTNKGGAFSGNTITSAGAGGVGVTSNWPVNSTTSGTLAVTWTITGANPALLQCNANSSLTPSSGYPRLTYSVRQLGQQSVSVQ